VTTRARDNTAALPPAVGDDEEPPRGAARVAAFAKRMLARF
jgi:hypothetical protein